ncbi:protein-glutamate methylesterase/protein-glutamine glutaminase [Paenibacillus harenae]|uniref:Protein-glutamate methylesterase/protein-glutamine glutaminase n=1 Tax=Paenibacillus harenae TaxID=306543 RepID=A0ABT9U303_PAEHA|nr:chemotaxis response regulator protein-glutamate methylesterase [Paenibacillus harenae]MDQ0113095.1 two-component system chemotaxis response regulator CheB [Paenibacillus harenae]
MAPYRILVVDDSPFMRKIISDLIVQDPQFAIVGTAENGEEAIQSVTKWKPDAITLDLEMPLMNGLQALQHIMKDSPIPVIMLSGISEENTRDTIKALQFGAFDFIRKPSSAISNDIHQVGELLIEKLKIAVLTKRHQPVIHIQESEESNTVTPIEPLSINKAEPRKFEDTPPKPVVPVISERKKPLLQPSMEMPQARATAPLHKPDQDPVQSKQVPVKKPKSALTPPSNPPKEAAAKAKTMQSKVLHPAVDGVKRSPGTVTSFRHIVAIGTSTGGPRALHEVICSLPANFPSPVLVVQHMPPKFTKSLAQRLDSFSQLQVVEATNGEKVSAGVVYIAPGGHHMELGKDTDGYRIRLTEQPLRNGHRPSVDVLFESLIDHQELKRHAVIMTGMGNDGTKGMMQLAQSGAVSTIAESEETCVVYGMPRCAIEGGYVRTVLPLQHIATELVNAVFK